MKNETARREIESLDYYLQNHTDDYSEESHTAMMMGIKALEQEPCEDAISREPFIDSTICEGFSCNECSFNRKDKGGCILEERVKALPSIQPKPKTGHWIWCFGSHKCSNCEKYTCFSHKELLKYCPNCGAKMVEPQESEDKE